MYPCSLVARSSCSASPRSEKFFIFGGVAIGNVMHAHNGCDRLKSNINRYSHLARSPAIE